MAATPPCSPIRAEFRCIHWHETLGVLALPLRFPADHRVDIVVQRSLSGAVGIIPFRDEIDVPPPPFRHGRRVRVTYFRTCPDGWPKQARPMTTRVGITAGRCKFNCHCPLSSRGARRRGDPLARNSWRLGVLSLPLRFPADHRVDIVVQRSLSGAVGIIPFRDEIDVPPPPPFRHGRRVRVTYFRTCPDGSPGQVRPMTTRVRHHRGSV